MTRYTWHQEQWQSVETRLQQGRLPHALLLTGPQGIGKVEFAKQLAAGLMCDQAPLVQACGQCQNCSLIAADTHPDKKVVTFEVNPKDGKVAKELKIDQIRDISESLALTAQFGGYKVAIVHPAERMNQNAANSILKTLEEPTERTLLILVTDFPSRLLPTIRSRCQEIRFNSPGKEEAKQWLMTSLPGVEPEPLLAMANGAPLLALKAGQEGWLDLRNRFYAQLIAVSRHQGSAIDMAAEFAKESLDQLVVWGISWVNDLIKLRQLGQAGQSGSAGIANDDYAQVLAELAPKANIKALYAWYDDQVKLQALVQRSLNPQQLLEKNFLDWKAVFTG